MLILIDVGLRLVFAVAMGAKDFSSSNSIVFLSPVVLLVP